MAKAHQVIIKDGEVVARTCELCDCWIHHPWDNQRVCEPCEATLNK